MGWFAVLLKGIMFIVKSIFGTDKAASTEIERSKPEVEVNDGKTDKERLKDLGM